MKRNVIDYLKDSVKKYPDKIAFVDENKQVTFSEVDSTARRIASKIIRECNGCKNKPIVVYINKGVDALIAFFAIAYSGNFYCPIDTKMPKDRILKIVETLKPVAVIEKEKKKLSDVENIGINIAISYDNADDYVENETIDSRLLSILDVDPLYVLFTSGSTGLPKGVIISHKGVIDYTEWLADKFEFDEKTVFGNQAPFYFDNSILDIYSTLKNGSTMVVIPESKFMFQKDLICYINQQKINTLFWVPSALISIANSGILEIEKLENIKKILFCGEVMPNKQLNIFRRKYPDIMYANLYGPTEITDVCTYYIVDRDFSDEESLPIGKACENTEILILNDKNELCDVDEEGELCVRGTGLSMGYYGDWEKSSKVFVQNPLNPYYRDYIYRTGDLVKLNARGEIIYLCRKDFQIKHSGFRIELGEIETAVTSIDKIERCCTVYDTEESKIILYFTASNEISYKEIVAALKKIIPKYMIPAEAYRIEEMPLNDNGKIDRKILTAKIKEYREIEKTKIDNNEI